MSGTKMMRSTLKKSPSSLEKELPSTRGVRFPLVRERNARLTFFVGRYLRTNDFARDRKRVGH